MYTVISIWADNPEQNRTEILTTHELLKRYRLYFKHYEAHIIDGEFQITLVLGTYKLAVKPIKE